MWSAGTSSTSFLSHRSAKICLTFCMQKIRILTELSPAQRKPHGLKFYISIDSCFMPRMKLQIFSSSWNQKLVAFHSFMLLYSGNPNHTIFNLGKTLLLFIRNCVLPPLVTNASRRGNKESSAPLTQNRLSLSECNKSHLRHYIVGSTDISNC